MKPFTPFDMDPGQHGFPLVATYCDYIEVPEEYCEETIKKILEEHCPELLYVGSYLDTPIQAAVHAIGKKFGNGLSCDARGHVFSLRTYLSTNYRRRAMWIRWRNFGNIRECVAQVNDSTCHLIVLRNSRLHNYLIEHFGLGVDESSKNKVELTEAFEFV